MLSGVGLEPAVRSPSVGGGFFLACLCVHDTLVVAMLGAMKTGQSRFSHRKLRFRHCDSKTSLAIVLAMPLSHCAAKLGGKRGRQKGIGKKVTKNEKRVTKRRPKTRKKLTKK